MFTAFGRAPYAQLPPEDLALLAADPALRARYCELAATVLLPPLRRLGRRKAPALLREKVRYDGVI